VARQAGISANQVEISRAALEAQVRPVLIDVTPGYADEAQEPVPYERAWARNVARDNVHLDQTEEGNFVFSVPLRNAGAGLAVIKDDPRLKHPARDVDYIGRLTKQVVPPGEATRASTSGSLNTLSTETAAW
jgi:hypothetical protein